MGRATQWVTSSILADELNISTSGISKLRIKGVFLNAFYAIPNSNFTGIAYMYNLKRCKKLFNDHRKINPHRGPKVASVLCIKCKTILSTAERRSKRYRGAYYCNKCWRIVSPFFSDGVDDTRRCGICKKYLPKSRFNGKRTKCKKCDYKMSQKFMKLNPEKRKKYSKKFRDKNRDSINKQKQIDRDNLSDEYIRKLLARYSDRAESEFTKKEIQDKRYEILKHREAGGYECWKSEMNVRKTLENIYRGFKFPSRRPRWNVNPLTGYRMEIDCYNKKLGIAVEYNGKQHYEIVDAFDCDEESLQDLQQRDVQKQINCKNNGIQFVTIPYWVDDYYKYLTERLE